MGFHPGYIRSGVYTMPEYLSSDLVAMGFRSVNNIVSDSLYLHQALSGSVFGCPLYPGVFRLEPLCVCHPAHWHDRFADTSPEGLVAVICTDTLQALLMIVEALTLMVISMMEIGRV